MNDHAHSLVSGLNAPQREAVTLPGGPALVLAGPGSGKTRVLTHRAAYLVSVLNVPPWRIMAVTFTNKAAKEMASRVADLAGDAALGDMTLGTFHALCARILRVESDVLPHGPDYVIFDTDDQLRAVKQALADLKIDDKQYRPQSVLGAISDAKNELIRPESYAPRTYWHEIAGRVYERYQQILRDCNALDFDDLLLETAFLLGGNDTVRDKYQQRYRHVLVDEFQDTNTAQYALLKSLTAAADRDAPRNLFVVGDEDQSIYRWRGADYRNILRLRRDYPDVRVVLLEQNYRSTQVILDAARAVIDANPQRTPKQLWTEQEGGALINLFEAYDEGEEAAYVVRSIEREMAAGRSPGEIAVMYRTNAQSRVLEDACVRRGLPYQLVGATRFYDRREVRDALAYLRLVHNPLDDVSLQRVINVPPRGIGPRSWAMLGDWAIASLESRWSALQRIAAGERELAGAPTIDTRAANALTAFHGLLAD
ncbi:MAG: ATP-dependent helicase, partial [Anaerolineae bacterium]